MEGLLKIIAFFSGKGLIEFKVRDDVLFFRPGFYIKDRLINENYNVQF